MRRFYLPSHECRSDHLVLTGSQAHHAADVLRLKAGDEVAVLDGAGGELACRVEAVTRKQVKLEVQGRSTEAPPAWKITLVQAIPKGKLLEAIIQKAAELGVWRSAALPARHDPSGRRVHRTQGRPMAADRRGSDQTMRPTLASASGRAHDTAGVAGPRR